MLEMIINRDGTNKQPLVTMLYKFKGFGVHPSECRVKVWRNGNKYFVLFIDLGKGTSVTNAAEQLVETFTKWCMEQFTKFPPRKEDLFFAEGYEGRNEGVDLIIPKWEGNRVIDVDWKHIGTFEHLQ